ncbi:MAG: DUF4870 domain-containing protein [Saprospirales bacterium]|nr:MAG: DUF4870 domain-containing protein [Saprospirales bacterium]
MRNYTEYYPLPQPNEVSKRERDDAMGSYLMMFASLGAGLPLPIINLLAAVIYYFVNKHKGRFVRFHLLQSLWSQIPVTLLNGFMVIWTIRNFMTQTDFSQLFFGLLWTTVFINVLYLGFSIYAAVRANNGRFFYFLFFGKLAYHQAYKVRYDDSKNEEVNLPPM